MTKATSFRNARRSWARQAIAATFIIAAFVYFSVPVQKASKAASPQTVVLSDNFEGATTFLTANGAGSVNDWVIGTATANGGTMSAYISNDAGVTNAYTITDDEPATHIYAPITVPAGETAIILTFDWKGVMEHGAFNNLGSGTSFDLMRVSLTTLAPVGGTMPAVADQLPIVFNAQLNFGRAYVVLPASLAGAGVRNLVFTFRCDTSGGSTAPAIDNVSVVSTIPAPLSGTKTIQGGGDYTSFAQAIAELSANGADTSAGNLTYNVAAGQTFNENLPSLTATGSATGRIIFQKSGVGANPKVVGTGTGNFGPTSLTTASATGDGVIAIQGGDFITFDGIDAMGNVLTGTTTTTTANDHGYIVKNGSATDGAQNIIIQNTAINLDRDNTASTAIFQTASSTGGGVTPTGATGANSNNQYLNLNLGNSWNGIVLTGNSTFPDLNNDIGTTGGGTTTVGISAPLGGTSSTTLYGIRGTSQSGFEVFNAEVGNISAGATAFGGIFLENVQGTNEVRNNKVHDITTASTSTAAILYGIRADTNSTHTTTVHNNMIWGFSHGIVTASATIVGRALAANVTGTGTGNFYFNSVRQQLGTAATNSAFYVGGGTIVSRNNIFANFTPAQTGVAKHYAIWFNAAPASYTSSNNILYISSGTGVAFNGFTGRFFPAADQTTLTDWQTATGQESASLDTDPQFASATDLHIIFSSPAIEAGVAAGGIITDIDGQARPNGANPDIGADEFYASAGTLQFSSATYSNPETSSASITVTRAGGANGAVQVDYATVAGGSATAGAACTAGVDYITTSGTLMWADLDIAPKMFSVTLCTDGVLEPGETVNLALSNVMVATLGTPNTAVLTITDAGTTFSGSYSVGTGEINTSLTNPGGIFEAMNAGTLAGNVTINITTDLTGETGAVPLNETGAPPRNELGGFAILIKPSGAARTIATTAAVSFIKLAGTDNVTIDGSLSGGTDKSLTINGSGAGALLWIATNATGGANGNTLKNCILNGPGAFSGQGIIAGSGTTFGGNAEFPNSNNTIRNNTISRVQNAAFIAGGVAAPDANWLIIENIVGSAVVADKLSFRGFFVSNSTNLQIINNMISGINSSTGTSSTMSGIQLFGGISGGYISRNTIKDIRQNNTAGWGSNGIWLISTSTASGMNINNNMISDIASQGFNGNEAVDNGYGIVVETGGGYLIYYNTVVMNTNQVSASGITAALLVDDGATTVGGIDLRDNILANTQTVGTNYSVYDDTGATAVYSMIDYNDYFTSENVGFKVAAQATLANWMTATGQDVNSLSVDPLFVSATDFHIMITSPVQDEGVTIPTVVRDFDLQLRGQPFAPFGGEAPVGGGNTDIGADEILAPNAAMATISGQVLTADGRGIRNAIIVITGGNLTEPRTAATGQLGYYAIDDLAVGQTYIVTINSKRFVFPTPSVVITLEDNISDLNFQAYPQE